MDRMEMLVDNTALLDAVIVDIADVVHEHEQLPAELHGDFDLELWRVKLWRLRLLRERLAEYVVLPSRATERQVLRLVDRLLRTPADI